MTNLIEMLDSRLREMAEPFFRSNGEYEHLANGFYLAIKPAIDDNILRRASLKSTLGCIEFMAKGFMINLRRESRKSKRFKYPPE